MQQLPDETLWKILQYAWTSVDHQSLMRVCKGFKNIISDPLFFDSGVTFKMLYFPCFWVMATKLKRSPSNIAKIIINTYVHLLGNRTIRYPEINRNPIKTFGFGFLFCYLFSGESRLYSPFLKVIQRHPEICGCKDVNWLLLAEAKEFWHHRGTIIKETEDLKTCPINLLPSILGHVRTLITYAPKNPFGDLVYNPQIESWIPELCRAGEIKLLLDYIYRGHNPPVSIIHALGHEILKIDDDLFASIDNSSLVSFISKVANSLQLENSKPMDDGFLMPHRQEKRKDDILKDKLITYFLHYENKLAPGEKYLYDVGMQDILKEKGEEYMEIHRNHVQERLTSHKKMWIKHYISNAQNWEAFFTDYRDVCSELLIKLTESKFWDENNREMLSKFCHAILRYPQYHDKLLEIQNRTKFQIHLAKCFSYTAMKYERMEHTRVFLEFCLSHPEYIVVDKTALRENLGPFHWRLLAITFTRMVREDDDYFDRLSFLHVGILKPLLRIIHDYLKKGDRHVPGSYRTQEYWSIFCRTLRSKVRIPTLSALKKELRTTCECCTGKLTKEYTKAQKDRKK
jgi:hypothetical protein